MNKRTAVIGASDNPERYSFICTQRLRAYGHTVFPVGLKKGVIIDQEILIDKPALTDIDTVTMYVGPKHQPYWEDYVLSLKPKRIIFNPGAENRSLTEKAMAQGIECLNACTLVMLSIGDY